MSQLLSLGILVIFLIIITFIGKYFHKAEKGIDSSVKLNEEKEKNKN